jgi:outer membrane receptor for monomeric catechols
VTPAITVGGGVNYVDKVYANVANNKYAPAYTRFDAMASYVVSRNVTLQLNIQNLTNKLYFDKVPRRTTPAWHRAVRHPDGQHEVLMFARLM